MYLFFCCDSIAPIGIESIKTSVTADIPARIQSRLSVPHGQRSDVPHKSAVPIEHSNAPGGAFHPRRYYRLTPQRNQRSVQSTRAGLRRSPDHEAESTRFGQVAIASSASGSSFWRSAHRGWGGGLECCVKGKRGVTAVSPAATGPVRSPRPVSGASPRGRPRGGPPSVLRSPFRPPH